MSGVPPNQVNYFSTIQFPINFNQQGFNPVYGPFPAFEFGVNGKAMYDYTWIYVVGCIAAFALAAANGANDVANSFATSVGSKALKMWQAVLIASICEFAGAALLGSRVTSTIRNNIATPSAFVNHDDLFMFGMMVAIIVVASWVFFATYVELAVSITHSIIGAILGFALCSTAGASAVDWNTVGMVVASWFISPAISAVISFTFFVIVRSLILRHKDAFGRVLIFFPLIVFITVWVNAVFIIFKGGIASISSGKGSGLASGSTLSVGAGFGIATGVAAGAAIIVGVVSVYWIKNNVGEMSEDAARELAKERGNIVEDSEGATTAPTPDPEKMLDNADKLEDLKPSTPLAAAAADHSSMNQHLDKSSTASQTESVVKYSFLDRIFHQKEIDDAARANAKVEKMHETAEKFDLKVELAFSYLQVFTACFASFAHGSNDVANSVGPLSAIVTVYQGGPGTMQNAVANKGNVNVPEWTLFVGCTGLVVGLALYGHVIIAAMGMKYTKITPTRGFCAEISFAFVVVIGSFLGIPLSTTQCIVGAILGIGLAEARKDAINWYLFGRTMFGWLITLFVCGLFTALFFSYAVYAPSIVYPLSKSNCLTFYGGAQPVNKTLFPFFFSMPLNTSMGDPSTYTLNVQNGAIIGLYGFPTSGQVMRLAPPPS